MLLALFGTNPYPFERLTEFLELLAKETHHNIIVQTGNSRPPEGCESFKFASHQKILKLMSKSDVVISQAGYGSCLDALKLGCTLVLVPRIQELAECLDDQQELADHISDHGQAQSVSTYFELRAAVYLGLETSNSEIRNDVQYGQAVANSILEHLNLKSVLE